MMAGRGRRRCGKRCSLKWNEHLLFPLEDNPAFGRQTQAPKLKVLFEQTYPDELLRQLAPLFSGMLFTRAEDAQAVVSSCHHLLRPRTAQHRDNMSRPEALTGHLHTGKKRLRRGRGVGQVALHGLHAVVTVSAGLPERLAEVGQQRLAAAIARLREMHQRLEAFLPPGPLTLGAMIDEMAVDHGVAAAVKQQAVSPQTGPPGAANLLVVAFQVFGEVGVDYEPDVGL